MGSRLLIGALETKHNKGESMKNTIRLKPVFLGVPSRFEELVYDGKFVEAGLDLARNAFNYLPIWSYGRKAACFQLETLLKSGKKDEVIGWFEEHFTAIMPSIPEGHEREGFLTGVFKVLEEEDSGR